MRTGFFAGILEYGNMGIWEYGNMVFQNISVTLTLISEKNFVTLFTVL